MTPDRFTCEEVFRRLDDFVDRELDAAEQQLVSTHLELCAACATEYKFEASMLQQIKSKVRRLTVPADLFQRISRAIESENPGT